MKAIRIHEYGGPEVMRLEEIDVPRPGAGEVLVRVEAVGVNFIDVYQRTGLYQTPLPYGLGLEAAGTIEAVGQGVTEFQVGDRVGWAAQPGSYAEYTIVPVERAVPIPPDVTARQAAAVLLQGMTAHYLVHSTYPLKAGEWALIHAAAGGVGLLLVQMAKRLGATVIGTVGNEAKAELARAAGADHVIIYTRQEFQPEVRRLTGGQGVHVVYDSVGKSTFEGSLDSLRLRGYMVTFGNASGPVPPIAPLVLNQKGGLFLTRPSLVHYTATRDELLRRADDVLGWVASGELKLRIEHVYPLAEAAQAHRDLEARRTTGKVLLIP